MVSRGSTAVITLVSVLSLAGVAGCSQDSSITETDAYRIGCPALDAVVGGGALGTKAAVAGLEKLRDREGLSAETAKWLSTAVDALKTTDPNEMPTGAKSVLVDGCQKNGYELRNLH
jgi:hypothetical protein